jgi:ATP-dependent exoDNAse (exonuclease V) alpha subunit
VLIGEAGSGKGVVLRTAAQSWRGEGARVIGTAVAGATAERLAADTQLEESMTSDRLISQAGQGRLGLDEKTVVMMDEAGMADTARLAKLADITKQNGSKLVLAGDSAQLSPIGAGGLFKDLAENAPRAQLKEVRRAENEWERDAWAQLRKGQSERALAAYRAHERLHVSDTREQAADRMVEDWNRERMKSPQGRTVILTDASNKELDRLNLKAQEQRVRMGELGASAQSFPSVPTDSQRVMR